MTKVLDKGHLILERHCGTDLDIVNAARQSFNQKSAWEKIYLRFEPHDEENPYDGGKWVEYGHTLSSKDAGLINYLVRERHGSPFEHTFFSFNVKAPIFVAREWMRHRAGHSFNEMSGRYTELEPEFYEPDGFRKQIGRPGAYKYEPLGEIEDDPYCFLNQSYRNAALNYRILLDIGVAKEQARLVLPVGTYTQFQWSCNARSLMHWLSLRNSYQAQDEIRQYAEVAEVEFAKVLPATYAAFIDNGRTSP